MREVEIESKPVMSSQFLLEAKWRNDGLAECWFPFHCFHFAWWHRELYAASRHKEGTQIHTILMVMDRSIESEEY